MDLYKLMKVARAGVSREIREGVFFRAGLDFTKPTIVRVSITDRCNYRCGYCSHWGRDSYPAELTPQEWRKIFENVAQLNPRAILQFSGGEPFLRSDCLEIFEAARSAELGWGSITNGYRLTSEVCKSLCALSPLNIDISLDAATPEPHDRARGIPGSFAKVSAGVRRLIAAKRAAGADFAVRIKCTVHALNVGDLCALVEMTREIGASSVDFSPVRLLKRDEARNLSMSAQLILDLESAVEALVRMKAEGAPIETTVAKLESMPAHFRGEFVALGTTKCHAPLRDMLIDPTGHASFCWDYPSLGDLRDTSAQSVWRGAESSHLRREAVSCSKFGTEYCATSCLSHRSRKDNILRAIQHIVQ